MSNLVLSTAMTGLVVEGREPVAPPIRIDTAASFREARSAWGSTPRYRYRLRANILRSGAGTAKELQQVASHFARHFGPLDSFLITDPEDNAVIDHGFGLGDGTTTAFQLQRSLIQSAYDALGGPWAVSSKPRTNLLKWSTDVTNAAWASDSVLLSRTAAPITDPAGAAAACTIRATGAGAYLAQVMTGVTSPGATLTNSVWIRRRSGTGQVSILNPAFTVWTPITVTADWQRFSVAGAAGSTNASFGVQLATSGDAVDVAFPQTEAGSAATQYIATSAAAVTVNPSYWPAYADGFEPCSDIAPGQQLYIESDSLGRRPLAVYSRTNRCLQSQTFDNASWTKARCTITANATTAPDGTATADAMVEDTTTNIHEPFITLSGLTAGETYTASVYVKASARTQCFIATDTALQAVFDLTTGTVVSGPGGTGISAAIVYCGSSWWRCSLTWRHPTGTSTTLYLGSADGSGNVSYLGTGATALYLWGAQAELGTTAGDYIVTTTTAASRTDYTLSTAGAVTFTVPPRAGAVLSWTGSYYRRVRFEAQALSMQRVVNAIYNGELSLISVI